MRRNAALAAVVLAGVLAVSPSVAAGFYADDYVHQVVLADVEERTTIPWWSLYDFGARAEWVPFDGEVGGFPWWTDDAWSIRFFRPLASLSIALDHAVFGRWAPGYHLVSIALFALAIVLAHRLYRALGLGERAALLATLLFALSDAAVIPVGWIANRNTLLCAVFTVLAAWLVARRERPAAATIAGALVAALCAALSKESGVMSFVVVAALLVARGRARVAVLPLAIAAAYVVALAAAGFGTSSGFYATPWRDPAAFASNLVVLFTAGATSLVVPLPLDVVSFAPQVRWPLSIAGAVFVAVLGTWIARVVRGRPGAGILALWAALMLVPQGSAPPSERLLFTASIGAAGLLALFFERLWDGRRERGFGQRLAGGALFVLATLGAGVALLSGSAFLANLARDVRSAALAADVGSPELGRRELFVLQAESGSHAFTLASAWLHGADDHDLGFWTMQNERRGLRWTRTGERSFELESSDGPFLEGMFERVYRASESPPARGTTWHARAFDVEAVRVDDEGLRAIRVTTPESLDAPRYRFLVPRAGRLVSIDPPAVGETTVLPRIDTAPLVL